MKIKRVCALLFVFLLLMNVLGLAITHVAASETRTAAQRTSSLVGPAAEALKKGPISRDDQAYVADLLTPVDTFARMTLQVTSQVNWLVIANVAGMSILAGLMFKISRMDRREALTAVAAAGD